MTKQKTIRGYKFITDEMKSSNGDCTWKLNEWKTHNGKIELCSSGFHACRTALQSLSYVYGNRWFIVEASGDINEKEGDKFVSSEMRLIKELPVKEIVVKFSCVCARRSLKNFKKQFPNDKRPEEAIQAAEDYMFKKITLEELNVKMSAAWSAEGAARSAARSAAWSAARSAARSAAWSAESAAWSAESAARSAAWSAEKKWQKVQFEKIVKEYIK
jgi:hypothetical protein